MYTTGEDLPLGEILDRVYASNNGNPIDVKALDNEGLREEFAKSVEDFDRERVYPTDIKKLFNWYNLLIGQGMTEFTSSKPEPEDTPDKED